MLLEILRTNVWLFELLAGMSLLGRALTTLKSACKICLVSKNNADNSAAFLTSSFVSRSKVRSLVFSESTVALESSCDEVCDSDSISLVAELLSDFSFFLVSSSRPLIILDDLVPALFRIIGCGSAEGCRAMLESRSCESREDPFFSCNFPLDWLFRCILSVN